MSPDLVGLIIDITLIALLIMAIYGAWKVHRRLGVMRSAQTEMLTVVQGLDRAILDAKAAVGELKKLSADQEARLKSVTDEAKKLADELTMITEAGNNLADRIESGLTGGGSAAAGGVSGSGGNPGGGHDAAGRQSSAQTRVSGNKSGKSAEKSALMTALKRAR